MARRIESSAWDDTEARHPVLARFGFHEGALYAVAFPSLGMLKVGRTCAIRSRFRTMVLALGAPLDVLFVAPGRAHEEMECLHRLRAWRMGGSRSEWFMDCPESRAIVEAIRVERNATATPALCLAPWHVLRMGPVLSVRA